MDSRVKLIQQIEQLGAALRDLAPIIANYYTTLIDEGVGEMPAAALTVELQRQLFGKSNG